MRKSTSHRSHVAAAGPRVLTLSGAVLASDPHCNPGKGGVGVANTVAAIWGRTPSLRSRHLFEKGDNKSPEGISKRPTVLMLAPATGSLYARCDMDAGRLDRPRVRRGLRARCGSFTTVLPR